MTEGQEAPLDRSAGNVEPRQIDGSSDEGKQGPIGRLIGIIMSPTETLRGINARPTVIVPIVLSIVWAVGFVLITEWRVHPDWTAITKRQVTAFAQKTGSPVPPDDQIEARAKGTKISRPIAPVIIIPIFYLILAGLLALGMMLMQGQATYKKILSVTAWTGCAVGLIYEVVLLASILVHDPESLKTANFQDPSLLAATNLAALMPSDSSAVLRSLASSFDVFSVWQILLLAAGLAAVSGKKNLTAGKTVWVVLVIWAFGVAIKVGIASLFGG